MHARSGIRLIGRVSVALLGLTALVAAALLADLLRATGRHLFYPSGWVLAVLLVAVWYTTRLTARSLSRWSLSGKVARRVHATVLGACTLLFALHSDFGWPDGLLEMVMWVLFVIALVAGLLGLHYSRSPDGSQASGSPELMQDRSFRRQRAMMMISVPAVTALVPLGLLHGVLCHAHGFLSYISGVAKP